MVNTRDAQSIAACFAASCFPIQISGQTPSGFMRWVHSPYHKSVTSMMLSVINSVGKPKAQIHFQAYVFALAMVLFPDARMEPIRVWDGQRIDISRLQGTLQATAKPLCEMVTLVAEDLCGGASILKVKFLHGYRLKKNVELFMWVWQEFQDICEMHEWGRLVALYNIIYSGGNI